MRKYTRLFLTLLLSSVVHLQQAKASPSLLDQSLGDKSLFSTIVEQGVPASALQRTFEFLDINGGKSVLVRRKNRTNDNGPIMETGVVRVRAQYAGIIDYSLPSTERRFYLINLTTGDVDKFLVAHGHRSGVRYSTSFSNLKNTKKTPLGMYLTGKIYYGFHRKSLAISGLEPSNSLAAERDIVLHGADYASEEFLAKYGRLGRSWGCSTVGKEHLEKIVSSLGEGSVLYFYHPQLMEAAIATPNRQTLNDPSIVDDKDITFPGEESDLQARREREK